MIQAVHHGKRNKRETKKFIHKIKERSDGAAPLFNFCSENEAFRECCNEEAIRFETKYTKRSPAMVEGIFDRILSLEELLMLKTPPTSKSS